VDDGGTFDIDNPDLAIDSAGGLYALWQDWRNGDPDVYFSYRPAIGSWEANQRVSDDDSGAIQYSGAIDVDRAGNAYALWTDKRNGNVDIYFSYRPKGGDWSANERVNDDLGLAEQWGPAIAVDDRGNAYALWQDERNGDFDVYYSYRPAGGSWSTNGIVNDDTGTADQYTVAIATQGSSVVAIWQDLRNGDSDIYSSHSLPTGNWSINERVNDDSGESQQYYPALALDASGNVNAVWSDERNGNPDIYFSDRRGAIRIYSPIVLKTQ
jgi:hypothetical protein